jgi:uncharacterized protein YndB with AHSA1/START domain
MPNLVITHDQAAIQGDIQIAAPPELVFQALTDPRQLMQWWGKKGMYHSVAWHADVRPGGAWRCEGVSDVDGTPYHVSGNYVDVDPPRVVSYTWIASWSGPLQTLVRWELEATAGGTLVLINHSGFAEAPAATKAHYEGWQRVVEWMRAFVEDGKTIETRSAVVSDALTG